MSRTAFASPLRIVIVDDPVLFRTGISMALDQHPDLLVVGQAGDGAAGVALAHALSPDIVLLDLCMPGIGGAAALRQLRQVCPHCAVLILTGSEEVDDLTVVLGAGARGYLIKNIDGTHLANAIRRAAAGEVVLSDAMTEKLVVRLQQGSVPGAPAMETLTPRERDILAALAEGASNKVIARGLGLAESTVKIHVQHVLKKLHLTSRVQAALFAVRQRPAPGEGGDAG